MEKANRSIQCSVKSCTYHCCGEDFCSLDEIKVSNTGAVANTPAGTECASFAPSSGNQGQ